MYIIRDKKTGTPFKITFLNGGKIEVMLFKTYRHAKQFARVRRMKMDQREIVFMTKKEMERLA